MTVGWVGKPLGGGLRGCRRMASSVCEVTGGGWTWNWFHEALQTLAIAGSQSHSSQNTAKRACC